MSAHPSTRNKSWWPAARVALCCLCSGVVLAQPSARVSLMSNNGVLMLSGTVTTGKVTTLTGVWGPSGQARLLACLPRCRIVTSIPLNRALTFGPRSPYRIVLGGSLRPGRKVTLVMRFGDGQVLNVAVPVLR